VKLTAIETAPIQTPREPAGHAGAASRAAGPRARRLRRDEVARIERHSHVRTVETIRGTIWLTATPARGDVLLGPGDRFHLRGGWPFVLQAIEEDAQIRLLP